MYENYKSNQGMIKAARVLGILTIVSACLMTVYLPYIFGGICVILAVLSMGDARKLDKQAQFGVMLAVVGMVFNTIIIVSSVYTVFTNPEAYSQFNEMFNQVYGTDFQDMLNGGSFL